MKNTTVVLDDKTKAGCNDILTALIADTRSFLPKNYHMQPANVQAWYDSNTVSLKLFKRLKDWDVVNDSVWVYPANWAVSPPYGLAAPRLTMINQMKALKSDKKILQVGTGYGTGICVVDPTPYVLGPSVPEGFIDASDPVVLLKAVQDQLAKATDSKIEEELAKVKAENEMLLKELADKRSQSWY